MVNGGDGANEHPSQALLDLYTIDRELRHNHKPIDKMTIALVGDLRFGRAVHSLCKLLALFESIQFSLVSPEALRLPSDYIEFMRSKGHQVTETSNLRGDQSSGHRLRHQNQEERFDSPEEALRYKGLFRLNQAVYTEFCQPNTVIMHPCLATLEQKQTNSTMI